MEENKEKGTKLSLGLINSYGLGKKAHQPDWDDRGYEYTFPSGIVLSGLFMCNGEPCEVNCLEGLDGYIYIDTEEELRDLINMSLDETFEMIEKDNPDFNRVEFE